MNKVTRASASATLLAFLVVGTAPVLAQRNPVDPVSNPKSLDYTDVGVSPKEMNPPFVRRGQIIDPAQLDGIKVGATRDAVRATLGDPIRVDGKASWDYDVQLKMPQSRNYLVCQYKVVFDADEVVRETVWRRRQCMKLAEEQTARD